MRLFLKTVPIWLIVADLCFTVILNIKDAFIPNAAPLPSDGLPVSPEFAFGWIQVLINGTMIATVLWGIYTLYKMKKYSDLGEILSMNFTRTFAALVVLAFAAPSVWLWMWALWDAFNGRITISFNSIRYLIIAICQPYLVWLFLRVWYTQHRLRHRRQPASFSVQTASPEAFSTTPPNEPLS